MTELRQDLDEAVAQLDEHYAELKTAARERLGIVLDIRVGCAAERRQMLRELIDVLYEGSLASGQLIEGSDGIIRCRLAEALDLGYPARASNGRRPRFARGAVAASARGGSVGQVALLAIQARLDANPIAELKVLILGRAILRPAGLQLRPARRPTVRAYSALRQRFMAAR
jgi:hypothetical protein